MRLKFIILILLLCLLFMADILLGPHSIDLRETFVDGTTANRIIFLFRLPKAVVALLAGIALSVSGIMMQTVFRNPLAGPYILGVSSGASLGVAMFLLGAPILGFGFLYDIGMTLSAWIGATAILLLVMAVSSRLKDIMAVLILGMMFGAATSAFVDILQYLSNESALKGFVIWSMGSLGGLNMGRLSILTGCTLFGLLISIWAIKPLNLLLLGENYARSMGLNVLLTRGIIFGATALLAGTVTAFCGPIAFIGTAVPHIARMIFRRTDHRVLIPASALIGACVMLLSDIISGVPFTDIVLPINTVTSLLGIPVIVMVVLNSRKNRLM